jgi:hypothetical protein
MLLSAAWWVLSLRANHLWLGSRTRIPAWRHLGLDFLHNYLGVRVWMSGGNPYYDDIGDWRGSYAYPPIVLLLFAWSALFRKGLATVLWMGAIAGAVAIGSWYAWRVRRALDLCRLPLVFVVGVMLVSMPVVFAMERGQADAICLLMIVAVAMALARPATWGRDVLIGACLAVATWVKMYPALAMLGLIALGAWRAFGLAVLEAALIGLIPYRATIASMHASAQRDRVGFITEVIEWLTDPAHKPAQLAQYATTSIDAHSLSTYWATFWNYVHVDWLARVPGVIGAALLLLPSAAWLSLRIYRSPERSLLAYPYLLWMTALATFWMPVSYDYNLFYLLLSALVVMDRRDSLVSQVAVGATIVWWQPFYLGAWLTSDLLMALKLASLFGIGASLARRASGQTELDQRGFEPAPPLRVAGVGN